MTTKSQSTADLPDPAAVFACSLSLWKACHDHAAKEKDFNLSECFNGVDQFMREVMSIGNRFEEWACHNINFNELNDVWPYLLEDKFGEACLTFLSLGALSQFSEGDCLRVALHMKLPLILSNKARDSFCIYINTFCQGPVPVVSDENGYVVFETELEAQREIVDNQMTRLQQFLNGEREFEDAIEVQEYVVPVTVLPDGRIVDEAGRCFGPRPE
jgi:hypothetical protein